jgi:hypothetical protein
LNTLTEKEILNELKRLGINSVSDLRKYAREYKTYNNYLYNLQKQKNNPQGTEKSTSSLRKYSQKEIVYTGFKISKKK